jgi:hypothetical protein
MPVYTPWRRLILTVVFGLGMFFAFSPAYAASETKSTPTSVTQPAANKATPKPVGEVVWVKGEVKATTPDKKSRVLKRKDIIYEHETLTSGAGSEGQVVFSDSGLLALRENTEFRIDEYKYSKTGDPSQNKYVANLVKGGFRTITGAISKDRPENYKVNTPVATIGVRGTQYSAFCGKGCQYKLEKGEISVGNGRGALTLNETSRYGDVSSSRMAPVPLTSAPSVFATDPRLVPATPSPKLVNAVANSPSATPASTPAATTPTPGSTGTTPSSSSSDAPKKSPSGGSKAVSGFCIS